MIPIVDNGVVINADQLPIAQLEEDEYVIEEEVLNAYRQADSQDQAINDNPVDIAQAQIDNINDQAPAIDEVQVPIAQVENANLNDQD